MAVKLTRKPGNGLLYSTLEKASMIAAYVYLAAVVLVAVSKSLVNGQRDVYTKRLYILKTVSLRSPFKTPAL